jgi:integrase
MKLSARKVQNAEKGTYQDGNGLILVKRTKANGFWKYRFSFNGKRPEMGLGSWPEVSLADARTSAANARRLVSDGINPIQARKDEETRRRGVPTLKEAIYEAHEARKASLKGEGKSGRWLSPLEIHIIPKIGNTLVTDIDQNTIKDVLSPIWRTKYPTADKALGRLRIALEYAKASGHQVDLDSVRMARIILGDPGHKVEHIEAMPWQEVPAFYQSLSYGSATQRVLAFMLLVGAGARTTPVRLAEYCEIDGDCWTVPGEKMKGKEGQSDDFRIPLSEPALELIDLCRELTGGKWIFPGPSGKPITDVLTSKFMRDRGLSYKPHGFRSSFRDWMAHTDVPYEVGETAIAHRVGNKVSQAYLRDDYWEKRKVIMHAWADHLSGDGGASVIKLSDRA